MSAPFAYAYLRVSTNEQTVENQRMQIESFAKKRDLVITEWFEDPATSGKIPPLKRKGFSELSETLESMKKVKDAMPTCVFIYELSRVGRTFWEVLEAVRAIEDMSPIISTSPKEGFLQTDDKSMRHLLLSILAWVAERERENLIQRTREGVTRSKAEGQYFGNVPLGFQVVEGKLTIDSMGSRVKTMLSLNPRLKPVIVQKELGIENYKEAWNLVKSVKKFG